MSEPAGLRTPVARAIGLGSAKEGVAHWWAQRITAVALVPLLLWFVASLVAHIGGNRAEVAHWIGSPIASVLLISLVAAGCYHMMLGLQVVIEDYVHRESWKLTALLANRFAAWLLGVAGVLSVVRIAAGG